MRTKFGIEIWAFGLIFDFEFTSGYISLALGKFDPKKLQGQTIEAIFRFGVLILWWKRRKIGGGPQLFGLGRRYPLMPRMARH